MRRRHCSIFGCIYCTACTLMFMFIFSFFLFLIFISPIKGQVPLRNPNKHIIVYYREITAIAWYKDNEFDRVGLRPFDQGHKNTTFLQAVFEGQSVIKLKPKQLGEYKEETSVGIYNDLAVDFDITIRVNTASYIGDRDTEAD
ncbi:YLS9 protein [Spatholobus suberectus]|nr:YLS9 protein [Spatholobus suberectus]